MIAVLLACVLGAAEATAAGTREDKNRPVTKVINLLKDMQEQMEKEQAEDQEVYWPPISNALTGVRAKEISKSRFPVFPNFLGLVLGCIEASKQASKFVPSHPRKKLIFSTKNSLESY